MSTPTLTYPTGLRVRHALTIGLIAILIMTSLVLIAGAILVIVSSAPEDNTYQADLIPVVQNLISPAVVAVPVPTPPIVDMQPISTPVPASLAVSQPSVVPIPVPGPPS